MPIFSFSSSFFSYCFYYYTGILSQKYKIQLEKKTRHKNLIFSNSIDFIYEYFNFENKVKKNFLSKAVKYLGKNNKINKILTNVADNGFMI